MSNCANCSFFESNGESCEFAYFMEGLDEAKTDMDYTCGYEMYQNYLLNLKTAQETTDNLPKTA